MNGGKRRSSPYVTDGQDEFDKELGQRKIAGMFAKSIDSTNKSIGELSIALNIACKKKLCPKCNCEMWSERTSLSLGEEIIHWYCSGKCMHSEVPIQEEVE